MSSVILTALYPCYIRSILCIIVLFSVSLLLFYSLRIRVIPSYVSLLSSLLYPWNYILLILLILSSVSLKLYSLNPSDSILYKPWNYILLILFILSSVSLKLNENLFGYIIESHNIFVFIDSASFIRVMIENISDFNLTCNLLQFDMFKLYPLYPLL